MGKLVVILWFFAAAQSQAQTSQPPLVSVLDFGSTADDQGILDLCVHQDPGQSGDLPTANTIIPTRADLVLLPCRYRYLRVSVSR